MSEMVERVAKAIHNSEYNGDGNFHWREETADIYRRAARAALTAMREPTQEMLYAAMNANERSHNMWPGGESGPAIDADGQEYWRAMIDAALAEKPVERE